MKSDIYIKTLMNRLILFICTAFVSFSQAFGQELGYYDFPYSGTGYTITMGSASPYTEALDVCSVPVKALSISLDQASVTFTFSTAVNDVKINLGAINSGNYTMVTASSGTVTLSHTAGSCNGGYYSGNSVSYPSLSGYINEKILAHSTSNFTAITVSVLHDWVALSMDLSSLVAGLPPNPSSVSATANPACSGTETQLTANNAVGTVYWYTGSCGNTFVGTGNPITVSPSSGTTYYARNFDGAFCTGCASLLVSVEQLPISGTLAKSPDATNACSGMNVSATFSTGSGGNNLDELQYRTQTGENWSEWTAYVSGALVPTLGKLGVEIRTRRMATYCSPGEYNTVSWVIDPASVGGSIAGSANVCHETNSTLLTLSGHTGTILKWQRSTDNWVIAADILNSSGTFTATDLTETTKYRALVQSGTCSSSFSSDAIITVDPVSAGGTVTGSGTVCSGTNSTELTLTGYAGTIVKWQSTRDNWLNSVDISNTANTFMATNLSATTKFRVVVQSGVCSPAFSSDAMISVDPVSGGGSVTGSETVCYGTNNTVLTLAGYTGTVIKWQKSTDNWQTPVDISNTTDSWVASNLNVTTKYRSLVQSGVCSSAWSSEAIITVLEEPVAPVIGSSQNIFYNTIPETLSVTTAASGGSGSFTYQWQKNDGGGWSNVGTGGLFFNPPALAFNTDYRIIASDAGIPQCCPITGNTITITVDQGHSISGTLSYYKNAAANVAMNNVELWLMEGNAKVSGYTTDDITGHYEFNHINNGNYAVVVHQNNKSVGGINATDAAFVNWWPTHFTDIEPVKYRAGDVQNDYWMQATDAYMIQQYFIYSIPFTRTTATGTPWTYWPSSGNTIHSNINPYNGPPQWPNEMALNVSNADVPFDILALCIGDFNGSYVPGDNKDAGESLQLISGGILNAAAGTEIEVPVSLVNPSSVGALSLILEFPAGLVEIHDVIIPGTDIQPEWAVNGNELRIGWYSKNPITLAAGEAVVNLRLTTAKTFNGGTVIRFALAGNPLNELADKDYNTITGAILNVDAIAASTIGIEDHAGPIELSLKNYPNPFSDKTTISYSLPFSGMVSLVVRNIIGENVTTLVNEPQSAGIHTLIFDGSSLSKGVCTATLMLGGGSATTTKTIKLVVVK